MTTPEFQLTAETTVIREANFFYNGVFNPSNTNGISSFKSGTNALVMDFSPWMGSPPIADVGLGAPPDSTKPWTHNENIAALIDQLSTLLTAGQLPAQARTIIRNFVSLPITSISTGTTSCTVTTSVAHGYSTNDSVVISGVSDGTFGSSLNNTTTARTITVTGPTTFTIPVSCTVAPSSTGLANAHVSLSAITYNNGTTSPSDTNKRDRLRAIIHLILASPDYTIQR
jgi:hypothetical protein